MITLRINIVISNIKKKNIWDSKISETNLEVFLSDFTTSYHLIT